MSPLRRTDIVDADIIDAYELVSDGSSAYKSGVNVVSTTSLTKTVVISGYDLREPDDPAEPKDIVTLTGDAAGTYTIASITDSTTFVVEEAIVDSVGGTATFKHPPGASKVGFDPAGCVNITDTTVQEAIKQLDGAVASGGITESQHKALRQLVHLADEGGPFDGFTSGAYRETTPAGDPFPTSIIWYDSSGVGKKKIVSLTITYNANKTPATEVWKVYDALEVLLVTVTDTISYSSIFETSRTRTWA